MRNIADEYFFFFAYDKLRWFYERFNIHYSSEINNCNRLTLAEQVLFHNAFVKKKMTLWMWFFRILDASLKAY